jgi:hypothetical protein
MPSFCDLAAPTRVSPTSAAEYKQDYENNQYGFHFVTSFVKRSVTNRLTPSLFNIVDAAKADVWSQWLTLSARLVRGAGEQSVCCSCPCEADADDTRYMIPIAQTERILVATVNDVREIDDSPDIPKGALNDSNPLMIAAVSGVFFAPAQHPTQLHKSQTP